MKEVINEYNVVPLPVTMNEQPGRFYLNSDVPVVVNASQEVKNIASSLSTTVLDVAGIKLKPGGELHENVPTIVFDSIPGMEKEAYKLSVTPQQIKITASTPNGFYYGLQTLYQLLPVAIYSKERARNAEWSVPCVEIEDTPAFRYRGAMLDVCRHFASIDYIKKFIDVLAVHKMNTFHWHLTDDQGWRIEIKKYPKLTETGAWRNSKVLAYGDVKPDGERYGGFYTQKDIKEIVAYAKKKFIEIVPEIDIPGHSQAAVATYPEFLACDPENKHEVWLQQGISTDVINVANPQAMQFAKDVIDELTELFPFNYIHLGGDECPINKWQKNEECKNLLSEIGSTNFRDLQIYFYKQLKDYIATNPASQQRQLIFWNEVLHGNTRILGNDITVMAWIGANAAAKQAAKQGMNAILSPQIPYYINRKQSKLSTEPMSQGHGTETVEAVYNYQPLKDVDADLQPYYKGVQANFWTEWVTEPSVLEYLMLPRLAAVAEAGWTPQEKRNYEDFKERIRKDAELYDLKGWDYGKHIMK